jgi:phosphoribosylamine-glycine ligase
MIPHSIVLCVHRLIWSFPDPSNPLLTELRPCFEKVRRPSSPAAAPYLAIVGIPVFGPSASAAKMEGSKAFSKEFMARRSIPTSEFRVFSRDQFEEACDYVHSCRHRVVLKASGLAGGKGVLIPENTREALGALREILLDNAFGSAGTHSVLSKN